MSTAVQSTPSISEELLNVPINQCFPSETNPRKHFPEAYINELAESIRRAGIINPAIIRKAYARAEDVQRARAAGCKKPAFGPGEEAYEIVAGECRYKASIVAGKDTLKSIVRDVPDGEVIEFQIIENLRRKDLEPLEEAHGYKQLMDMGKSQEEIAERIGGMSVSYISSRIKLCSLVADGKEILSNEWISAGHAILIARLPDGEAQISALTWVFDPFGRHKDFPLLELAKRSAEGDVIAGDFRSEKQLRTWIKENFNLDLKNAPWDKADPDLFPEAGPCTTCPYRSGSDATLFADLVDGENKCLKPPCYQEKMKRHIKNEQQNAEEIGKPFVLLSEKESEEIPQVGQKILKHGQWIEVHKGECPDTVEGMLMDGDKKGNTLYVCKNINCKHKPHKRAFTPERPAPRGTDFVGKDEIESAPPQESASSLGPTATISGPSQGGSPTQVSDRAAAAAENRKREEARAAEQKRRQDIALAIVKEVSHLSEPLLRAAILRLVQEQIGNEAWVALKESFLPPGLKLAQMKTTQPEFAKVVASALLCRHIRPFHVAENGREEFESVVESIGFKNSDTSVKPEPPGRVITPQKSYTPPPPDDPRWKKQQPAKAKKAKPPSPKAKAKKKAEPKPKAKSAKAGK